MTQSLPPERPLDHVDTWVFDLDNTLYPARYNLFDLVDRKIGAFVATALRLDEIEARRVQKTPLHEDFPEKKIVPPAGSGQSQPPMLHPSPSYPNDKPGTTPWYSGGKTVKYDS